MDKDQYIKENVFYLSNEKELEINLYYPRVGENPNKIAINLVDVRCSDGIKIEYDFDRDGWVIYQQSGTFHDGWSEDNGDWVEVSFAQSWTRYKESTEENQ